MCYLLSLMFAILSLYYLCVLYCRSQVWCLPFYLCIIYVFCIADPRSDVCHSISVLFMCSVLQIPGLMFAILPLYYLCVLCCRSQVWCLPFYLCIIYVCCIADPRSDVCHSTTVLFMCAVLQIPGLMFAILPLYYLCVLCCRSQVWTPQVQSWRWSCCFSQSYPSTSSW